MKQAASVDITIGHAVDSVFESAEIADPWAYASLSRFVDAAVNHPLLAFTYPSADAIANDADENLPLIFAKARGKQIKLIDGLKGRPADSMPLTEGDARAQFDEFQRWLSESPNNGQQLREWTEYHRRKKRIVHAHTFTVPNHYAAKMVARSDVEALGRKLALSPSDAEYALDVFLRGILYARACGNHIVYFSHPVRESLAIEGGERQFNSVSSWSWGRYFVNLLSENERYRNSNFLLEKILALREHTLNGATWYSLAKSSPSDQLDRVRDIASRTNLPFKLPPDTQKNFEQNLRGAGTSATVIAAIVALTTSNPVLAGFCGMFVAAGTLKSVELTKGYISPNLATSVLLAKRRVWPGLADKA